MRVVVLGGGESTERDVSLRSAKAVADALESAGYEVVVLDPRNGFETLDSIIPNVVVLPILHGSGGEDGVIQLELEKRGLPYLGSDSKASATCFDKWLTRLELEKAGLPVAKGSVVSADSYRSYKLSSKPHVLKVTTGGSSIGTYIVKNPKQASQAKIKDVFALGAEAVVEELVVGTEITVGVLDKEALPVIEIIPPDDAGFDYENKYNGATKEICPPVSVNQDVQEQAKNFAVQAHQALGCRHLSRTDFIVRPDGSLIILEINTMPGMTNQSLYPTSASFQGLDMPKLVDTFVTLVKRDYDIKE